MDLKLVHTAVDAYAKGASRSDAARLRFFEGLFDIQQQRADLVAASDGYEAPAAPEAFELYRDDSPVFSKAPVTLDAAEFQKTCEMLAAYLASEAGLADEAAQALAAYDWSVFVEHADLALAGSDPALFIERMLQSISELDVPDDLPANVFMMVPAFALRAHLQPAAELVAKAARKGKPEDEPGHVHPVDCPICGTPSTASWVGAGAGSDGRGREQYCSMCGHQWEYERVRCGACGSTNQNKLHYKNLEGDSAHRLLTCDDCGGYQRVVFREELDPSCPMVMEVEDVVMAKLDQVALDPRFHNQ